MYCSRATKLNVSTNYHLIPGYKSYSCCCNPMRKLDTPPLIATGTPPSSSSGPRAFWFTHTHGPNLARPLASKSISLRSDLRTSSYSQASSLTPQPSFASYTSRPPPPP